MKRGFRFLGIVLSPLRLGFWTLLIGAFSSLSFADSTTDSLQANITFLNQQLTTLELSLQNKEAAYNREPCTRHIKDLLIESVKGECGDLAAAISQLRAIIALKESRRNVLTDIETALVDQAKGRPIFDGFGNARLAKLDQFALTIRGIESDSAPWSNLLPHGIDLKNLADSAKEQVTWSSEPTDASVLLGSNKNLIE